MSFFSDLFEGNFSNLGTDIVDAPSSLINHPDELAETIGVVGLGLGGLGAIGALGDLGALGAGAADAGALTDLGAGATGGLAADLGIGDIAGAAAADSAALGDAAVGGASAVGDLSGGLGDAGLSFDTGIAGTDFVTSDPAVASYADSSLGDTGGLLNYATDTINTPSPTSPDTVGATADTGGGGATPAAAPSSNYSWSAGDISGQGIGSNVTADPAVSQYENPGFSGTGGVTGTLSSILSSPWTKLATGIAPLALTLGMGEQGLPQSAQQLQAQALQMQQTGLTNLAQAQAGVLNTGQTAQLTQMRADLTNQWLQTLKNQGVQDPTKDARWPQIEAAIDSQISTATANLIQQNITNALSETGQASSALTSIANMQLTADQQFTNNLLNATKSLGVAAGASSLPKITIGS